MKINYSEYTLISFGDSFTFGQDAIDGEHINPIAIKTSSAHHRLKANGLDGVIEMWKSECNEKAYTQIIADAFGFKNNLNFGVPGSSNERSLNLLDSFLRQNPTLKVFVLFNFTATSRHLNILKLEKEEIYDRMPYDIVDVNMTTLESREATISGGDKYVGINKRSIENLFTYFRNEEQETYQHIKDRRALYNILSAYDVPHVSFDILNGEDARILIVKPTHRINSNDGLGIETLYNNDESYVFTEMELFESYTKELIDNSPRLSHIGLDCLAGAPNINIFIDELEPNKDGGKVIYRGDGTKESDYLRYHSEYGMHWSIEGHKEVAKLIEKFIKNKYDT